MRPCAGANTAYAAVLSTCVATVSAQPVLHLTAQHRLEAQRSMNRTLVMFVRRRKSWIRSHCSCVGYVAGSSVSRAANSGQVGTLMFPAARIQSTKRKKKQYGRRVRPYGRTPARHPKIWGPAVARIWGTAVPQARSTGTVGVRPYPTAGPLHWGYGRKGPFVSDGHTVRS